MWMTAGVVCQFEFDGRRRAHAREGARRCGSRGASDEQPDLGVEAFVTAVGQPAVDGGVDPGAVLADGARGFDELDAFRTATLDHADYTRRENGPSCSGLRCGDPLDVKIKGPPQIHALTGSLPASTARFKRDRFVSHLLLQPRGSTGEHPEQRGSVASNRAMRHLNISGRREPGLQGRVSEMTSICCGSEIDRG